jgi:hypothetical protein
VFSQYLLQPAIQMDPSSVASCGRPQMSCQFPRRASYTGPAPDSSRKQQHAYHEALCRVTTPELPRVIPEVTKLYH